MSRNDFINSSVPEWAGFFTLDEYNQFIEFVSAYFLCKGLSFKIEDGLVNVGENEFGFGKNGLDNIARTCKQLEKDQWEYRINYHFDALGKSFLFQNEIDTKKDSFEFMKQYISVRIFSNEYMNHVGEKHFIKKQIADDLIVALVFDYPDSIQNMQEKDIANWNKNLDELFEIGKENAKNNNSLSLKLVDMQDYSLYAAETNHFYAANIYFELDKLDFLDKQKGCIVAFPGRHCSIIYPIKNIEVVKVINKLIPVIYNMNHDGAGPISSCIYWYKNGTLKTIPYSITNNAITINPSPEFVELLNLLAG